MREAFVRQLVVAALALGAAVVEPPLPAHAALGPLCYVDASKTGGSNTGESWTGAYTHLQSALSDVNCAEIWVAEGVYKPGTQRTDSFQIGPGKAVYGGFAGTESTRAARNWATHVTTLSGDIGTPGDATDNSYHVVFMNGVTSPISSTTVLDGFTITAGNANGAISNDRGGGLYCYGQVSGHVCSPTLANLTFNANSAVSYGGALFSDGSAGGASNPTLTSVVFSNNSVPNPSPTGNSYGGAVFDYSSSPSFMGVTFSGNSAMYGGAIDNQDSSAAFSNVTFIGNSGTYGGAMYNKNGSPSLTNVTFTSNSSSQWGGAMHNYASNPTLTNVTFTTNSTFLYGGGIYSEAASQPNLTHVAFSGNSAQNGGGMLNDAGTVATLLNASFTGNSATKGAGVFNGNSTASLTNVTFANNTGGDSSWGGGLYGESSSGATLSNVTFSGNSATNGGGMLTEFGSVATLTNVTFNGNSATNGGGMYSFSAGTVSLTNVILWGDSASSQGPEAWLYNSTTNIDHSVVQGGCASIGGATCPSGNLNTDPRLAPLADYGGSTQTMALLPGSSAIDSGTNSNCSSSDQRGQPRPADGNNDGSAICDIGAYELQPNTIAVHIGGSLKGIYPGTLNQGQQITYAGTNTGPAQVTNSTLGPAVSSVRVIYAGSSYSEMMGYPNNTTTQFWFPWYNNAAMDSQFRVSNLGGSPTTITVSLAGSTIDSFSLGAGAAVRKNYPGQNNGPMQVTSSGGVPILATIRVLYGGSSYSEMMGFPNDTTTQFWFPWYNNTAMDSQFRVSNLSGTSTTITVSLAGSPIDSFTLGAGTALRKNYPGQNNGPMQVSSIGGAPILATIRVLYGGASYSEMMGYPSQTTTDFWFPWYDDVGASSQLRVSNLGASSTDITVTVAGSTVDTFSLAAGTAARKSYSGLNNGVMRVSSSGGIPILSTVRIVYGVSSFYEVMGYPGDQLTPTQFFPWYNNTAMDSQLRFGVP